VRDEPPSPAQEREEAYKNVETFFKNVNKKLHENCC
jgi:hypothetical protein